MLNSKGVRSRVRIKNLSVFVPSIAPIIICRVRETRIGAKLLTEHRCWWERVGIVLIIG